MKYHRFPIELLQWKSPLELQLYVRLDGVLMRLEDLRSEMQRPILPEKPAGMELHEGIAVGSVAE